MAEYIKREDAVRAAIEAADEWDGGYITPRAELIEKYLDDIPSADVVEVVRCKDCRFYDANTHMCELYGVKHWEKFYCMDGGRGRLYYGF